MFGGEGNSGPHLVPVRFVWPHGGRVVHLCGSFTRWHETIPMAPVDNMPSVFDVFCSLPPGLHQYKFIVDGEWRHDEGQDWMVDPLGNINNWKQVTGPDDHHPLLLPQQAIPPPLSMPDEFNMELDEISHRPLLAPPPLPMPKPQPPQQQQAVPPPGLDDQLLLISEADAELSRQRISDFLQRHTAYELLPESGKVVAFDVTLPVKQAFHALHEQGVPAAPLWDSEKQDFVGMLSASDFITILRQLRSNGAMLSEEELETHTIAAWKDEKLVITKPAGSQAEGNRKPLVYAHPDDSLRKTADQLLQSGVSTVPVLVHDGSVPQLLHLASLTGVLRCVSRHFRHVPGSLPLLSQPLRNLPLGTWTSEMGKPSSRPLATVRASAPLTQALAVLLNAGVSALPVLDDNGAVVDVYARSDITALAKDRAYTQRQLDEFTVQDALLYRDSGSGSGPSNAGLRCHMCLRTDTLRTIIDRLSLPGARRVICVEPGSKRLEGIVSLTDIFQFLLA